jgi:hypothetical protein
MTDIVLVLVNHYDYDHVIHFALSEPAWGGYINTLIVDTFKETSYNQPNDYHTTK